MERPTEDTREGYLTPTHTCERRQPRFPVDTRSQYLRKMPVTAVTKVSCPKIIQFPCVCGGWEVDTNLVDTRRVLEYIWISSDISPPTVIVPFWFSCSEFEIRIKYDYQTESKYLRQWKERREKWLNGNDFSVILKFSRNNIYFIVGNTRIARSSVFIWKSKILSSSTTRGRTNRNCKRPLKRRLCMGAERQLIIHFLVLNWMGDKARN